MVDWFCYAADFVGFERLCGWSGEGGGEEEQQRGEEFEGQHFCVGNWGWKLKVGSGGRVL